jgi:hypothetical protein
MTLPAVTIPYTFAAESGNQPATQLDQSYGVLATFLNNIYEQTSAESLGGVTPTNYYAPVGASWSYISRYNGSLAQGLTVAGTAPYTLYIDTPLTVASNLTVPATCALIFIGAGTIAVSTGFTLTITGPIFGNQANTSLFTGTGNTTISTAAGFYLGGQLLLGNATGGYQGTGTINAQGLFVNGASIATATIVELTADFSLASQTTPQPVVGLTSATLVASGVYLIQLRGIVNGATSSGAGYRIGVNYSGSTMANNGGTFVGTLTGNLTPATAYFIINGYVASASNSVIGSSPDIVSADGIITVSTSGTLEVQFAQNSSSANTTYLRAGSSLLITRLA